MVGRHLATRNALRFTVHTMPFKGACMILPAYKGGDAYIFVCHSHADIPIVYADIARLQSEGVNVWYDEGIHAGRIWRAEVAKSIQGASRFLYFISGNSLASQHCAREIEYALSKDVPIVPVYLDDSDLTPELDLVLNRVHALHRDRDTRYEQHLLDALSGTLSAGAVAETSNRKLDPKSIAVLPLLNIDGSEQTAIFASGLMDSIIDRLARIPGLRVSSRRDSHSVPGNASSDEVRARLRVCHYIEGSVSVSAGRIRVVINLIDSGSGRQLQSRRFDRKRDDFFDIQDEITRLAIANLRVALPDEAQLPSWSTAGFTTDIDAYVLYRRGVDELHKPTTTQTIEQALHWFEQSLEIDNDYAAAYAGKCQAYSMWYKLLSDPDLIVKAENACATALTLNPNLNVVHNALGELYWKTGQRKEAEDSYRRALATNPNDATALKGLAMVFSGQQRSDEAEEKFRQVIALQPGNWVSYNDLGSFLFQHGRYAEAAASYREVVALDANNVQGLSNLGTSLMLSGRFAEATPAFERAIELQPQAYAYANLGLLHYYMGHGEQAVGALEKATETTPKDHVVWMNLGDALTLAARPEEAHRAFVEAERLARARLDVNRTDPGPMIDLAWSKAMLGAVEEALNLINRAVTVDPGDPYVHYTHGLVLTRMGEPEKALLALKRAVDMGYPLAMLRSEPHLAGLRDTPRYEELVLQQENVPGSR